MAFYRFARALVTAFLKVFYRITYKNQENLPKGAYLLCSNHRSMLDPFIIGVGIKEKVYFMAKAELFKFKPFGYIVRLCGGFPVERGKGDLGALKNAVDTILGGEPVVVFPEGTRSKDGVPLRPHSGIAYIERATDATVVPACIACEGRLRPFKKITVSFGKPIAPDELPKVVEGDARSAREMSAYVMSVINKMTEDELACR